MSKNVKTEPNDSSVSTPISESNSNLTINSTTTTSTPRSVISNQPKSKSKKSRNGCLTCKKKRLKCDETKPSCLKCLQKNIVCGGYATKFKWRSFNDNNEPEPESESQLVSQLQQNFTSTSPQSFRKHLELASLSVTGKSIKDIKRENDLIAEGINPATYKKRPSNAVIPEMNSKLFANLGDSSLDMNGNINPQDLEYYESKKLKRSHSMTENHDNRSKASGMARSFSSSTASVNPRSINDVRQQYRSNSIGLNSLAEAAVDEIKTRSPGMSPEIYTRNPDTMTSLSPTMSDFLTPAAKSPAEALNASVKSRHSSTSQPSNSMNQLAYRSSFQNLNLSPSLSALINTAFGQDDDLKQNNFMEDQLKFDIPLSPLNLQNGGSLHEFLETHLIPSPVTSKALVNSTPGAVNPNNINLEPEEKLPGEIKIQSPSAASEISPSMPLDIKHTQFPRGQISESMVLSAEHEQILGLYSQYTAEILSIKNGPNENPWRKLILPYAFKYSCLFNSIASITLFHLAGNESVTVKRNNMRARGYMYMKRCVLELVGGLSANPSKKTSSQKLPADIAIAICLNLSISETWDKHTSSGIAHLKGAKTMIQNVLSLLRNVQEEMSKERRKLMLSPDPSPKNTEDYGILMNSKRDELKQQLVLVEDSEWDRMLSGVDEQIDDPNNLSKPNQDLLKVPRSTQFLFNMWIYFEVLAQMTTESDEKGVDLVASITTILQDSKKKAHKTDEKHDRSPDVRSESSELTMGNIDTFGGIHRGFNNLFDNFENMSLNSDYVDPLLGCAQSLFSIMGKVAALISKIRKGRKKDQDVPARNTLSTITRATQLKQDLMSWKPTISAAMIEQANSANGGDNPRADLSSYIATAEAYRFASLLYLHQAVPEIPSLSSHQLAEKIFILLASIPTTSPTYTVHIFPLLVSSCEAEEAEEREWCEERWRLLSTRLWIGNVDRAFEVVKEVWRRKDDYLRKKQFNSVSIDDVFIPQGTVGNNNEKFKDISTQLSGLMAAINEHCSVDDITGGIYSKLHWSTIMKEWGWEVLLG